MSMVQVDKKVKKRLLRYAAKLQQEAGRKVSLSEAIDKLLDSSLEGHEDKQKLLSLFGVLRGEKVIAQKTLKQLRKSEEKALERKYALAR